MKSNIYLGPFKKHLQRHIELKRALGYKYETDAEHLMRFDRFTMQKYPNARALTKEIVLDWCNKRAYEAQANQLSRASIIRQLGKYLDSIGIKAYVLPKGYFPSEKKYIPYTFTTEELTRFFAETDKCQYCCECPYRHLIMPIIFYVILAYCILKNMLSMLSWHYEVNMKFNSPSEKLLIEEVMQTAHKTKVAVRGLSIGALIKSIRLQLGMSQKALAKRAGVPQSTISRIEQGERDANLSTLNKILGAISCDLVIVPLLQDSIEAIRRKQAKKVAESQVRYLKGTMNLEDQQPDSRFTEELIKQEEERLLQGSNSKLWDENA